MKRALILTIAFASLFFVPAALIAIAILLPTLNAPEIKPRSDVTEDWVVGVAARYAPIFLQEINVHTPEIPCYDYMCAVNFDGDWDATNNLDHLQNLKVDLSANVYYSLMESETHFFISYSVFHPLEWDYSQKLVPLHDSNMEHLQVVVKKKEKNTIEGHVEIVAFQRANTVEFYKTSNSSFQEGSVGFQNQEIMLANESGKIDAQGTHTVILIRSGRHRLEMPQSFREIFIDMTNLHLKHGLQYLPTNASKGKAPLVSHVDNLPIDNQKVSYGLLDIADELWEQAAKTKIFRDRFSYDDRHGMVHFEDIPVFIKGNQYKSFATFESLSPFVFGRGCPGEEGILFFNPILGYQLLFEIPTFSRTYLYYPYSPQKNI